MTKKLDKIYDKIEENEWEIMDQLTSLIKSEWDSNSLKKKLEKLAKKNTNLSDEFDKEFTNE